jgi:hypothetical protein
LIFAKKSLSIRMGTTCFGERMDRVSNDLSGTDALIAQMRRDSKEEQLACVVV